MTRDLSATGDASARIARPLRVLLVLHLVFGAVLLFWGFGTLMGRSSRAAEVGAVVGVLFVIAGLSLGGPLVSLAKLAKSPAGATPEGQAALASLAKRYALQIVLLCVLAAVVAGLWIVDNFGH